MKTKLFLLMAAVLFACSTAKAYDALIDGGLLPIKRWGTPEDIAHAVSFLASDKAKFITGQVLSVNGGFVI